MEMMEKPLFKFNLNYVKFTKLLHFKVPQHSQKVHSYGMQTPEKQVETISGFFPRQVCKTIITMSLCAFWVSCAQTVCCFGARQRHVVCLVSVVAAL